MNHIYRSIWNEALGAWIAASEIAKGQGKGSSKNRKILATGLIVCSTPAWALPTGEQVMAGQANVSVPNAHQMQINQASQKAVINWQGFSIKPNESVNIQQPNSNAALLNRVTGQDASQIQGKLNANGQVYIVNPNGVVFSKTAQVDVGGLVATTHNIKDADFMNGKQHFTQDGAKGKVENHGTIKTPDGGVVALIGESVTNTGTINTPKGTTALAAGKTVDLDFKGDGLVEVKVSEAALNAQITNKGAIQADGGRVVLTAKAAGQLIDTVINQDGVVRAQGMVERNGEIILEGGTVSQTGTLDASGKTGGTVTVNAKAILDAGTTNADGKVGNGGKITMNASDAIIQTAAANTHANGKTTGGTVHLEAVNSVYSSGKISATGEQGGTVNVVSSDRVTLAAADVDASGSKKAGLIRVGGDFHGKKTKLSNNAKTTTINGATKLKADGGKGKVVVWSDEKTDYYGSISANKIGEIEVSSKGTLTYAGSADAGKGGHLSLDPKNIIISSKAGAASYGLIDPHLAAGNNFGANTALLGTTVGGVFTENGNIAVSSSRDDFAATDAGAVYLFNTKTGALLSTLLGSRVSDNIGSSGITALSNGNYVISSVNWDNGGISDAGAVTWGNGLTGISGTVSAANSLVGSRADDQVGGFNSITVLSNGNYVVGSSLWDNGATAADAGAVTWGNGFTGISGVISATNSLVGATANDFVGSVTALTNGNYVVSSSGWDNGTTAINAGAVTWGNGFAGSSGVVGISNSLVGSTASDFVGNGGVTALANGNYVVASPSWNIDPFCQTLVGAATWGNGNGGTIGAVSSANSLIGANPNDNVSSTGITALTNGNYVVASSNWLNGTGAVSWGNGNTGTIGVVGSANSLIGSNTTDKVGSDGVIALTNGNYVVASPNWSIDPITQAFVGAATWGNGNGGTVGAVSATNSLIGSNFGDFVSSFGITALSNGNYVVRSANWNSDKGAVTWGKGLTGIIDTVSATNSLVGSTSGDSVGGFGSGITQLSNGNYVVSSPFWNGNTGAATWANGLTAITGIVSATNSLIGANANDLVSSDGITALGNGNYVVRSSSWNNGTILGAGAATWGNGLTGIIGTVSAANSLVGSRANDNVSSNGIATLSNGNYVVSSPNWDNNGIVDAGAATWGNGFTGISGTISAANSLVGSHVDDLVSGNNDINFFSAAPFAFSSIDGITALPNGNYVVSSVVWNKLGAVTWGNGLTGITGIVSTVNSLTGSVAGDLISSRVTALLNGNYILSGGLWDNLGLVNAGQIRMGAPSDIFFSNGLGQTMTFNPSTLASTLASGTNVTLQASNDIILDAGTNIIVGGFNGGSLTLQAGRHITLNSSIFTANGNFTAIAGDPFANPFDRDAGTPFITLGSGATINAGSGKVILAALGGNFVNNSGSAAPITASQWLIYSTDPRLNNRNGMQADFKHYGQTYTGLTPDYANVGNWFLYSITPVLTVTPNFQITPYGTAPARFTFTLSGFIDDDTIDSAGISGSAVFGINDFTGAPGFYNVAYLQGLASRLGYIFIDNFLSVNELLVTPPPPIEPVEPIVRVNFIEPNFLISQVSTLQRSAISLPLFEKELAGDRDLLDIKNEGMKLPAKFHKIISLSICPTGMSYTPAS